VPADGFYEWQAGATPKARKQPFTVALRDGRPMALAGLWEGWRGPGGETVRTFVIVTTDATEKLRPLHDRMPVILPREAWLGGSARRRPSRTSCSSCCGPSPSSCSRPGRCRYGWGR